MARWLVDKRNHGGIVVGYPLEFDKPDRQYAPGPMPRVNMLCCVGMLVEVPARHYGATQLMREPVPNPHPFDFTSVSLEWLNEPMKIRDYLIGYKWIGHPGGK